MPAFSKIASRLIKKFVQVAQDFLLEHLRFLRAERHEVLASWAGPLEAQSQLQLALSRLLAQLCQARIGMRLVHEVREVAEQAAFQRLVQAAPRHVAMEL